MQQEFIDQLENYRNQGKHIAYGDESGFAHDMPRTRGYSLVGTKCYGLKNFGNKGRENVIGAIISGKFITATIFDCNIDNVIFNAWLCEDLLPKLPDNNVLVLDNASFHNKKFINTALQKHGHVALFLPPYSPELNSIERKWAQVKSIRRKERCNVHKLFQQYAS